MQLFALYRCYQ